jgi:LysM repeat protein
VFPDARPQEPRLEYLAALAFLFAFAFGGFGCALLRPCDCSQAPVAAAPPPPPSAPPPPASAEAPADAPAGWQTYRVKPGDTLMRIATCRGVSVGELARENAIFDPDRIEVGWSLRVPPDDLCKGKAPAVASAQRPKPAPPTPAQSAARPAEAARAASPASAALAGGDARARELLETARADYDAALFEAALRGAEAAAAALARAPRTAGTDAQRAQAHVLAGMSAAGLEDRERAIAEFERAFALDADAQLDPADQSPRLVELFQLARGRRAERAPSGDL